MHSCIITGYSHTKRAVFPRQNDTLIVNRHNAYTHIIQIILLKIHTLQSKIHLQFLSLLVPYSPYFPQGCLGAQVDYGCLSIGLMMEGAQSIRELLKPKKQWKKDNQVTHCFDCGKEFLPIVRWRHHCRFCGNIFCSKCCEHVILGEEIGYAQEKRLRHCVRCRQRIKAVMVGSTSSHFQSSYFSHKSEMYDANDQEFKLDLDDTIETASTSALFQSEQESYKEKAVLEEFNRNMGDNLSRLSLELCQKHGVDAGVWRTRLSELALRTVNQVQVDTFVRSDYFHLLREIRVVTIVAPKDSVTAACVKGLILERNVPSKQLPTHLKFPNVLLIKPAIEAESLMRSGQAKFDLMIKNQNSILREYLQKIYRLKPNVVFVAQHVSKVAFEDFLQNGIMVISKVRMEDLRAIQRLAMIRKVIDHLHFIDKYRPVDVIGVCQKIYFKTIRPGEMIMVMEQEGGMRSVLLGDSSEEINAKLKAVFAILLRLAWRMKKGREAVFKDLRFTTDHCHSSVGLLKDLDWSRYCAEKLHLSLEVQGTRILYRHGKAEELQKLPQQQYVSKLGFTQYYSHCHQTMPLSVAFRARCYDGQDLLLGTYLLKSLSALRKPCKKCLTVHAERFFIGKNHVTIRVEPNSERTSKIGNPKGDQEEEQQEESPKKAQPVMVYESIVKHFQRSKEKMNFIMFFKCETCGQVVNNQRVKLGREYLSISLLHFLSEITSAYGRNNKVMKEEGSCEHTSLARVIQSPRAMIKLTVGQFPISELSEIQMGQGQQMAILVRDEKYLMEIYRHEISEKYLILQNLQNEIGKIPFASSIAPSPTSSLSSISGIPFQEHPLFGCFLRAVALVRSMAQKVQQIQNTYCAYFALPLHDWTIVMRKLYKTQQVLKILHEVFTFIAGGLRKEKVEESNSLIVTSIDDHLEYMDVEPSFGGIRQRKDSEQTELRNSPISPQLKASKHSSTRSMVSLVSNIRKDTGGAELEQIDDIFKKSRRHRFPLYHGIYLYYPIGNTHDPVSLLACCLNSEQFHQALKEQGKDFVTCRVTFAKQLQTEWPAAKQSEKLYKETLKEDYPRNETYEYSFSIYYHREFQELRQSQGVNFSLYIRSLYGCQNWDSSGGKSNSTFSKSHNELLVVKIINEKQFVQFQKFALGYLNYMKSKRDSHGRSYLAKIYGIYQATIRNKVYKFVVMQNIFLGVSAPMKVYDLKGSQVNRLAAPIGKAYTGLDTNFIFDKQGRPYVLEAGVYDRTVRTFEEDAAFLRDQSVIDYSLLVIQTEKALRMGIIDFMRPYHLIEKIENKYKEMMSGKDPTVIEPTKYAERFVAALKRYFIKVPSSE